LSQISFVNKNAFSRPIAVDTSLLKILRLGLEVSEKSDGNFDMTIGAIKKLWHFGTDSSQVPDSSSIRRNVNFVNYKLVELSGNTVKFKKSGLNLDLGGIAKGYAIDEAMRIIKEAGIRDAMVNAGGDLRVISGKLTRGKRRILVKHPRKEGAMVGFFPLDSGSVATSGDYERFFIEDSVRYHHILDPKTGYPSRKCVSVTVQTTNATIADALATAIFVMGPDKGMIFVNKLPDTEALIIYQNENGLDYIASAGLAKKFVLSEDWQNDEKITN
jgi:thiamine biosynthesis lipoprotein